MAWKQTSRKISGLTGNSELTQEQLAEVLGVSVGAVYKCESRSSLPELRLIMEMADFFDISVDALLPHSSEITDRFHSYIPSAWERFHRPLSRLAVDRALAYLDESAKRMADSEAVLLHGDANATNLPGRSSASRFISFYRPEQRHWRKSIRSGYGHDYCSGWVRGLSTGNWNSSLQTIT